MMLERSWPRNGGGAGEPVACLGKHVTMGDLYVRTLHISSRKLLISIFSLGLSYVRGLGIKLSFAEI